MNAVWHLWEQLHLSLRKFKDKYCITCTYMYPGDTGLRGPNGETGLPGTKGGKGDQGD